MEQGKNNSYKSRVFSNMNNKMRLTEERARDLKETVFAMNSFKANYKRKMKTNFETMMKVEEQRHQEKVDALNKLLIFQTNCDMNVKYDTNGFADIVNEVKPDHDKFRDECFTHGCNNDLLGHIAKLNFTPYDEFMSDDEVEELNKSHDERISNDLTFFIEKKCLGDEDNEVEPLTESDKNAFWMALNEKHGPRIFCE